MGWLGKAKLKGGFCWSVGGEEWRAKDAPLNSSRGIIDEEGEKMRRRRRRGPQSRHLHTLCCTEPRKKGRGNVERLSPAVIRAISGGGRKRRKRGGTVPVFNTGGARFNILYNWGIYIYKKFCVQYIHVHAYSQRYCTSIHSDIMIIGSGRHKTKT